MWENKLQLFTGGVCSLFINNIAGLGFPSQGHSLHAGGTIAAVNAKVPDQIFKRSENARMGIYVNDKLESRLEV